MTGRSRFACARRLTALMMTALLLGGCSTWRMQGQAPATVVSSSEKPRDFRVTLQDGRKLEVCRAILDGDSLVGSAPDPQPKTKTWDVPGAPTPQPAQAVRVAVALSDIRAIEIRAFNGGKTVLLITGMVALVGVAYAAFEAAHDALNESFFSGF